MSVTLSPPMFLQFFSPNNSGAPAAGYLLFTYIAGTSTKQATWTDSTQTVQNANPIVLDSNGAAYVWGDPTLSYKFVFCQPNDTDPPTSPLRTVDNIQFPINLSLLTQAFIGQILYPRTPAEISAGVTPTNYFYPPSIIIDIRRYGFNEGNSAATNSAIIASAVSVASATGGAIVAFPPGHFLVTDSIAIPANVVFRGSGLSTVFASGSTGNAVFMLGGPMNGTLKYGCGLTDCQINLSDVDGKAVQLMETVQATVENMYIQGPIAAVRSSVGILIDGGNASAFFNIIKNIECSHVHVGFDMKTTGTTIPTQQFFYGISASGDVGTDTSSVGFRIQAQVASLGNGTLVCGADFEACGDGFFFSAGCGVSTMIDVRCEANTRDGTVQSGAGAVTFVGGDINIDGGGVVVNGNVLVPASTNNSAPHRFIGVGNGSNICNTTWDAGAHILGASIAGQTPLTLVGFSGDTTTPLVDLQNSSGSHVFQVSAQGKFLRVANAAAPTITGSKGGNAALGSLLTALAGMNLIVDSTT